MRTLQRLFAVLAAVIFMAPGTTAMEAYASNILAVKKDGNVSDSLVGLANSEMNLVPDSIQRELMNRGWSVYVTDQNLDQAYFFGAYGSVSGMAFQYNNGGGFVKFENRENAIRSCVPHELGHAIDHELGDVSGSAEFSAIFNAEKNRFYPTAVTLRSHLLSGENEFFAAVFDEYCRNRGNCAAMVPQAYAFMENQLRIFTHTAAPANGWQHDGKGWKYLRNGNPATGWILDGCWYYLKADGYMATGWIQDRGTWYYMNSSGAMATGWVNDRGTWYYMNSGGAMMTGWICTGGKWYYLTPSGAMKTGWLNDGGRWYYLDPYSGAMATGRRTIDGTQYYFSETSGGPLGALQ